MKVVLIPIAQLRFRFLWLQRPLNAVDVVASASYQPADTMGPQRCDNTGCSPAPVVPGKQRGFYLERIEERFQVMPQGSLLS